MDARGKIGIVPRVSDVGGRDKKGNRFISPQEQIRTTETYCRAAGHEVIQGANAAQIDGVIALAMAAERAQHEEEPARLLGWV